MPTNFFEINSIIIIASSKEVNFACPVVNPGSFILKNYSLLDK